MRPVILVLVILAGLATAASARTWHIRPDGNGDAPTIQAGIDLAQAGDIVELACGEYFPGTIHMKTGITLKSETGRDDCSVLHGRPGTVGIWFRGVEYGTVQGLVMKGHGAGAMRLMTSSPLIKNCYFKNNTFTDGGAIHMLGSSPTIRDCTFVDNHTTHAGGAVSMGGSWVTMTSCIFEGNSSNYGGAVNVESWTELVMVGCTVTRNSAARHGGGIFVWQNLGPSTAKIHASTIMDNHAPNGSDGWVNPECRLLLEDCVLAPDHEETFGGPGDFQVDDTVEVVPSTWGSLKSLYR